MHGIVASEVVDPEVHQAHQDFSLLLNESDFDPEGFPVNAILAGDASQRALGEVLGWYTFESMPQDQKDDWLRPPFTANNSSIAPFSWGVTEEDDELNDEKLVQKNTDTAGRAAVAYACGPASTICEPERLEEFWTWWLTEALPQAWQMARDGA